MDELKTGKQVLEYALARLEDDEGITPQQIILGRAKILGWDAAQTKREIAAVEMGRI